MNGRHRPPALVLLVLFALLLGCEGKGLKPPISLGKKNSLVGQGEVVTLTNTSDDYLHEVRVSIEAPSGESRELTLPTLEPHETESVGWLKLDGWPVPVGAKVKVTCEGYVLPVGPWKVPS